jgi:hypothetical protein
MQKLFLAMVLLSAAFTSAFAQTPTKPADQTANTEQALLKLTRDWLDAEERVDRATLQRIIADDFQGTGPMGNMVIKDEVIPEAGSRGGLSVTASNLKARIFGDVGVVTGGGMSKSGEKGELRFTVIYAKRADTWQMVAGHLSAVPR